MLRSVPFSVGVFLVSSGATLLVAALVLAGMAAWQPNDFPSNWPVVVLLMSLPGLAFLAFGSMLMYWSVPPASGAPPVEARWTDLQAELERLAQRVRSLETRPTVPLEASASSAPAVELEQVSPLGPPVTESPPVPPPVVSPSRLVSPEPPPTVERDHLSTPSASPNVSSPPTPSPPAGTPEPFWTAWRLSLIAGALILFIGVAYFLRSIVQQRPEVGIVLALMTGVAVLTLGHRMIQRGWRAFGLGIDALGLSILYLSLYAAFWYYRFIPQAVAFAGMALTTLTGVGLALRYTSAFLIVMALTGGFLTPLWLSTGQIQEHMLFPYLIVLNLAIPVVLTVHRWRVLYGIAYFWTQVYWWAYLLDAYRPDRLDVALGYGAALFLIFLIAPLLYPWLRSESLPFLDLMVVLGNGILGFASGWSLLAERLESAGLLGLLPLGFAGIYAATAGVTSVRVRQDRVLRGFLGSLAVVFLTLVFPVQWDWHWVTVGWAAEAVALTWLGTTTGQRSFRLAAGVVTALMLTHLWVFDTFLQDGVEVPPFWNVRTASYATCIVALFLQQACLGRTSVPKRGPLDVSKAETPEAVRVDARTWAWVGIYGLALSWLVMEIWRSMGLWDLQDWRWTAVVILGALFTLWAMAVPPTPLSGLWRFIGHLVLGLTFLIFFVFEADLEVGLSPVLNHRTVSFGTLVGTLIGLTVQAHRRERRGAFQIYGIGAYLLTLVWVILEVTYALERAGQPEYLRTASVTGLLSLGALPALRWGKAYRWQGLSRTGGILLSVSIAKLFLYDWMGARTWGLARAAAFITVGLATLIAGWWTYRKRMASGG
ncbi:MAG: DUF2339 domain-containing protein [Acidobacteria bacterium]|nr:DUF2339 domain-containing protein [Acidobacteriota bacterium]MDW7984305.1 DUF2339 domain-containing protein [Acidobacteriota bacterium]